MSEESLMRLLRDLQKAQPLETKRFEIRAYGKSELALLYFPHVQTAKGALNNLNYWINYNPELRQRLRELGSPPRSHHFTRREVELIVEYLCEP